MKLLLCVVVLSSLSLLGRAKWTHLMNLDDDLDNQLCPSETHKSTIIDIHKSMDLGAELMDGLTKASVEQCVMGCCRTEGCDLALFKNEGLSKTGKNCYYVHCGLKSQCVMVEHSAFTTVLLLPRASPPRTLATEPTPTDTPNSVATTSKALTTAGVPSSPPHTTSIPATEKAEKGKTVNTTSAMTTTTMSEEVKNTTEKNSTSAKSGKGLVSNKESAVPGKSGPADDVCGEYGCDGSGIVAVVVVAVICFAIVLVVVAIVVKKAVDQRRRRKFRNVDYLINGMYT